MARARKKRRTIDVPSPASVCSGTGAVEGGARRREKGRWSFRTERLRFWEGLRRIPSRRGEFFRTASLSGGKPVAQTRALQPLPGEFCAELGRGWPSPQNQWSKARAVWYRLTAWLLSQLGTQKGSTRAQQPPLTEPDLVQAAALRHLHLPLAWFLAKDHSTRAESGVGLLDFVERRFASAGEEIVFGRYLSTKKIFATWSKAGRAAVPLVTDFVADPLRELVEDPWKCFLPTYPRFGGLGGPGAVGRDRPGGPQLGYLRGSPRRTNFPGSGWPHWSLCRYRVR